MRKRKEEGRERERESFNLEDTVQLNSAFIMIVVVRRARRRGDDV